MKKILILEKDKTLRKMINSLFENDKYKIMFTFPLTGNSKLSAEIPDLVIADLTSIKKEKVELLMQLKNNPIISLVPFLMIISGEGAGSDENFSIQNYYLKKPFTKENLILHINKIINHTDNLNPW